jgi:hypothetical protein
MVCAPDLGTLHAARRKATTLASLGLQSNISLIMNRVEGRSALPVKDIELLLRLPVRFTVPSAPKEISEATRAGKALEGKSNLVMQIESIAKYMVGTTSGKAPPPAPKKRFLDYFSISDVRDKGSWAD